MKNAESEVNSKDKGGVRMIDIKQYLEQTNTVLLTKDAFEYLKERASVPDKVKAEYDPSADLISREETLTAFADYVGSGMSMNDFDALWDIVAKIPAANPQLCEDAISRENAIIRISWDFPTLEISKVKESLDKLPSVTPQPKTGHWIRHDNGKYHWYLCSCCDAMVGSDEKMMAYKYCPNCGAKMVEPQESEAQE